MTRLTEVSLLAAGVMLACVAFGAQAADRVVQAVRNQVVPAMAAEPGGPAGGGSVQTSPTAPAVTNPDGSKWKRTLAGTPTQPQTKVTDRDWPATEGAASVCLWHDDSLAAFSYTIDDNNAMDLPWWMEIADRYKIKLTWFVVIDRIDATDGRRAQGGKWEGWRKVYAKGHDVQSHSWDHMRKGGTLPLDQEYGDAQKAIEKNIPGDRCLTLAYPGGGRPNDIDVALKYYIACRGGVPAINVPGKTSYEMTRNTSQGIIMDTKKKHCIQACLDPQSPLYRGWYVGLTHFVGNHEDTKTMITDGFYFVTKTPGDFWLGRYRDVVLYGMERDTHTLRSRTMAPGKYELALTCQMDPAMYDFPLTVKLKIRDSAKTITAKQADKPIDARMIENAGKKFALVEVVPNRGPALVEESTAAKTSDSPTKEIR